MNTSIFLAKLIGPLALVLGFGVLFNRGAVRAVLDEFINNRAILFLAGLITFPAGLAIVLTHNVWVADWPVIITIVGWLTAFSGAIRIVAPEGAIRYGRRAYERPNGPLFSAAIWIALGAVLTFFGYVR
ncbi:MAG: hypothetical protein QOF14_3387 [Hyphomicrobiales bacterium]|nr:hypothetical protein [Hyphomicrobiales bacterium]